MSITAKQQLSHDIEEGVGEYLTVVQTRAVVQTGCEAVENPVDAVPLRYGKWECTYWPNGFLLEQKCSECGLTFEEPSGHDYNYCPNCGARMDAE